MDGIVEQRLMQIWRGGVETAGLYVALQIEGPCRQHGQYYLYCNDIVSLLTKRLEVGVAWAMWSDERSGEHEHRFCIENETRGGGSLGDVE
jgi:hypothetical protein